MKKSLIPIKYAFIILALYQLYSIFKNWGHDESKVAISIVILIWMHNVHNRGTFFQEVVQTNC